MLLQWFIFILLKENLKIADYFPWHESPEYGLSASSSLPVLCLLFWKGILLAALSIVILFMLQIKGDQREQKSWQTLLTIPF